MYKYAQIALRALYVPLCAVLVICAFLAGTALAADPLIADIEVRGLKRMDNETVFSRISLRPGMPVSPSMVSSDIKELYSLGYFRDIRAELEVVDGGLKLIYVVSEKPSVRRIDYFGNDEVSDDEIDKVLNISPGSIADRVLVEENAEAIRAELSSEGFPRATVVPILREVSDQSLLLTYFIEEGPEIKVDEINFLGNRAFSDRTLRKKMKTVEWWFMSWLTGSGHMSGAELRQDMEKVRDYYHSKGYIKAVVHEPEVEFEDNLKWLDINIRVQEGKQYYVGAISFAGSGVLGEDEMARVLKIKTGEVLDRSLLMADVEAITSLLSTKGYALATIYPEFMVDEAASTVDVRFLVTDGKLYDVGRIEIHGNYKTRDKVIRREFRLNEGDIFDSAKLKKSYRALTNLNFFGDIKIDPRPDAATRKLNIRVEVKEKLTGSFNVGGGYSSVDKFMGMVNLTFGNLGGRGQYLKLNSRFSSVSTTYELEFRDPWFLNRPLSFSSSVYKTTRDFTDYNKSADGFTLGLGKRFWEYWSTGASYRFEKAKIYGMSTLSSQLLLAQSGIKVTSSISPYLKRDSRDNYMMPHSGSKHSIGMTYAGLGGDNHFFKMNLDSQVILPVSRRTELSLKAKYGYAIGLEDQPLPLYERYFVGSVFSVRGLRRIGPRDPNGNYIGGGQKIVFNADYTFPAGEQGMFKWLLFYDAGTAFDKEINLRYTAGAGFKWFSPIGPMSLVWAKNLYPLPGEPTYRWEFAVGAMF